MYVTYHLLFGSKIGLALQMREPNNVSVSDFDCKVFIKLGIFTNISSSVFMRYFAWPQFDVIHFNIITDFNVKLL